MIFDIDIDDLLNQYRNIIKTKFVLTINQYIKISKITKQKKLFHLFQNDSYIYTTKKKIMTIIICLTGSYKIHNILLDNVFV